MSVKPLFVSFVSSGPGLQRPLLRQISPGAQHGPSFVAFGLQGSAFQVVSSLPLLSKHLFEAARVWDKSEIIRTQASRQYHDHEKHLTAMADIVTMKVFEDAESSRDRWREGIMMDFFSCALQS